MCSSENINIDAAAHLCWTKCSYSRWTRFFVPPLSSSIKRDMSKIFIFLWHGQYFTDLSLAHEIKHGKINRISTKRLLRLLPFAVHTFARNLNNVVHGPFLLSLRLQSQCFFFIFSSPFLRNCTGRMLNNLSRIKIRVQGTKIQAMDTDATTICLAQCDAVLLYCLR